MIYVRTSHDVCLLHSTLLPPPTPTPTLLNNICLIFKYFRYLDICYLKITNVLSLGFPCKQLPMLLNCPNYSVLYTWKSLTLSSSVRSVVTTVHCWYFRHSLQHDDSFSYRCLPHWSIACQQLENGQKIRSNSSCLVFYRDGDGLTLRNKSSGGF